MKKRAVLISHPVQYYATIKLIAERKKIQLFFENYSPLVRPGGRIVFHDIVEDNDTRYRVCTGGVPAFWQEIKKHFRHVEFVDHPEQDGLGIGVLFVPETGVGTDK